MYDSRSSHPRVPAYCRGSHPKRAESRDFDGQGVFRHPYPTKQQVIEEGIEEAIEEQLLADLDGGAPAIDVPGLKRLTRAQRLEHAKDASGLAAWEIELLFEEPEEVLDHLAHDPQDALHTHWCAECCEEYAREAYPEFEHEPEYDEDADLDYEPWLPVMSISDAYQELGDGFTIEGPSRPWKEVKSEHYVRVYELAREVGIEAKHLVADLRLNGEYVHSHMSLVAVPVADYLVDIREVLIESYGPREERPLTWAQERAEWDRKFATLGRRPS